MEFDYVLLTQMQSITDALGKMQYLSSTPLHNSVIYGKSSSNRQRNGFIGLSPLPGSPPAP